MADYSAVAASSGTNPSSSLPDAPNPFAIKRFLLQFLTGPQISQISQQFLSSWRRNEHVMWTGNTCEMAQKWADQRQMQTLTMAMGPLVNCDDAWGREKDNPKKRRTRYMRGASALFAWFITTDDVVTVLCPPPPDRLNPGGGTNIQLVELPILTGIIGGRAVSRIEVVHPMVEGAEGFRYQFWPVDEARIWRKRFAKATIKWTPWLQRARTPQVRKIEELLRSMSRNSEVTTIFHAILPEQGSQNCIRQKMIEPTHQKKGIALRKCEAPNSKEWKGKDIDYGEPSTTEPKKPKGKGKKRRSIACEPVSTCQGTRAEKTSEIQQKLDKKSEAEQGLGKDSTKKKKRKRNKKKNKDNKTSSDIPNEIGGSARKAEGDERTETATSTASMAASGTGIKKTTVQSKAKKTKNKK